MVVRTVPAVAFEEAVDDVLGVGVLEVDGGDGGDFRPRGTRLRACQQRDCSRARQQFAARDLAFSSHASSL